MKVTIIQNKVFHKIEETLKNIENLLSEKEPKAPDFIIFPEMFTTPYELKYFESHKQKEDGIVVNFLKNVSRKYNSYVIGGSIPCFIDGKIYNRTYIFDRSGRIIVSYDKIHLFEITYPNGTQFKEADVLTAGNDIKTFETDLGKFGIMICFDIRFPLLASKIANNNVKAIFVPAAFNSYTGPLHWQTTFRARAIDNQLFTIGVSPSSDSYGNYQPYGHSIVCDPFGRVLLELGSQEEVSNIDLDLGLVEEVRNSIPILKNAKDLS